MNAAAGIRSQQFSYYRKLALCWVHHTYTDRYVNEEAAVISAASATKNKTSTREADLFEFVVQVVEVLHGTLNRPTGDVIASVIIRQDVG